MPKRLPGGALVVLRLGGAFGDSGPRNSGTVGCSEAAVLGLAQRPLCAQRLLAGAGEAWPASRFELSPVGWG